MNQTNKIRVICLRSDAFFELIDEVVERINEKHSLPKQSPWIDAEETMNILKIKSRTTLQKLRDEGKIKFAKMENKNILYDRQSLLEYIEKNAIQTF